VPASILRECASLSTLHLQDNPITAEALRELDGFDVYNARRLAKCNKQVTFASNSCRELSSSLDRSERCGAR
jgi:hypothetical protein